MGFQIIKAETRVANMITWFAGIQKKITDFVVGGKTRTKFEAIAVEMESQDLQFYIAAKKAIATGTYQSFSFQLLPAVRASGNVTFTASPAPSSPIAIPIGTRVATVASSATPEIVYQTTAAAVIDTNQTTVTVPIAALTAGIAGNTGVGTIVSMKTTLSGISTVANAEALTNGAEKETESARRTRFQTYIASLTRGTGSALVYAATSAALTDQNGNKTEQVVASAVTGPPDTGSAGTCTVYIFNGTNGASSDLIARAQTIIDGDYATNTPGYKAAGVVVTVLAATTVAVNVTIGIVLDTGATVLQTDVEAIISGYFSSFTMGSTLILNELIERLMSITGVVDVVITAPAGNVTTAINEVLVPGTVAISIPYVEPPQ